MDQPTDPVPSTGGAAATQAPAPPAPKPWRFWGAVLLTLALGGAGGAVFAWLGLPLPWMIGAMVFTTAAALGGAGIQVPIPLRGTMVVILGIMLGSGFHPVMVDHLGSWALTLAGLVPYLVASLAIGLVYLRRVAHYDPVTAYFTAAPGGLNEMVLVGGALGGDVRTIALSHSARVMLVVLVIPSMFQLLVGFDPATRGPLGPGFADIAPADYALLAACVAGVPLAQRLHFPTPTLTGPMLLSAAIHLLGWTETTPPGVLIAAAQVVVGSFIGARFAGTRLGQIGRGLMFAVGQTVLMLLVTLAFASLLATLTGIGIPDLVLAYSPGGLAEMSLIALALDLDPAFVATHHIARILLVILLAPVVFRLLRRRGLSPPASTT